MRRKINWPDGKGVCCTFTVAFEAFAKSGRFKKSRDLAVNLASISHSNYGGNVGIWRIMDICERNGVRATIDVNGLACERWPDAVKALHEAGHEIAGHGTSNDIHMTELTAEEQRTEIRACKHIIKEVTGTAPVGWVGPGGLHTSETLGLLAEEGYTWCGDQCDDDLPYVVRVDGKPITIIPKHWYFNDWRAWGGGQSSGEIAYESFKASFDFIRSEAARGIPGRIDALVHAELGGRPYMAYAFEKMITYLKRYEDEVWFCHRRDIAEHCLAREKNPPDYRPLGDY